MIIYHQTTFIYSVLSSKVLISKWNGTNTVVFFFLPNFDAKDVDSSEVCARRTWQTFCDTHPSDLVNINIQLSSVLYGMFIQKVHSDAHCITSVILSMSEPSLSQNNDVNCHFGEAILSHVTLMIM